MSIKTDANVKNLTEGNINKILLGLTLPLIGSSFLQLTYGLIDMMWIGRLGSEAIAAVGTAGFIINLCISINTLVTVGAGIKSSHTIGEKNFDANKNYISAGIFLNIILFIICVTLAMLFARPIINVFNLNASVTSMAQEYLAISIFGLLFKFQNFFYARIYSSFGNSKLPFNINLVGVGLNIILDPIFIFTFDLGIAGAAWATIIAEGVVTLLLIKNSKKFFVLDQLVPKKLSYFVDIARLGFPLSLQRILFTIFSIIIARIVSQWGSEAIAAQKIGIQIESITYMTIGGLHGAMASFIGQNYGAKSYDRIRKGYKIALFSSIQIGIVVTALLIVFAEAFAKIFVSDIRTVELTINYLQIVGLSQIFMCMEIMTSGAFNGLGNSKIPSTLSIVFTSLRIPLALFLSQDTMYGINGIWMTIALTSVVKGILSMILYFQVLRKKTLYKELAYE